MGSEYARWRPGLSVLLLLLCAACAEIEPNHTVAEADAHRVFFVKGYEWRDSDRQLVPSASQVYHGLLSDSRDVDNWTIQPLSDANSITFSAWVAPTLASGQCMRVSFFKCTKPGVTSFGKCPQANRFNHFQEWHVCPKAPGDLSGSIYPHAMAVSKDELMLVSVLRAGMVAPTPYMFTLSSP